MKNTPNEYTLKEIADLRSLWLAEGLAKFDQFARIAREMGTLTESIGRPLYVFTSHNLTVVLNECEGPYDTAAKRYHRLRTMTISIGPLRTGVSPRRASLMERELELARIDSSTYDPNLSGFQPDDLFYRPGKWVDVLLSFDEIAVEREKARAIAAENETRDRIFYQLSLNKEL
jgi:hypothetical protein